MRTTYSNVLPCLLYTREDKNTSSKHRCSRATRRDTVCTPMRRKTTPAPCPCRRLRSRRPTCGGHFVSQPLQRQHCSITEKCCISNLEGDEMNNDIIQYSYDAAGRLTHRTDRRQRREKGSTSSVDICMAHNAINIYAM